MDSDHGWLQWPRQKGGLAPSSTETHPIGRDTPRATEVDFMKIESRDLDVRTMLSSGWYKIPRFQRPYSWDRENIQDFWDDVVRDNPGEYFIGSMVVYKDGPPQTFGVVDGQQRITTITILLCAIRNLLRARGFQDLATGIHGVIERKNIDNRPEFVVSTESSYPYFQDRIQKWDPPSLDLRPLDEEKNLQAAFDQLSELLAKSEDGIDGDPTLTQKKKLDRLREKMTEIRDAVLGLKLISVQMDDEDDAYLIFETLNTRGKDLSLSDLVKNHLTKSIRSKNKQTDEAKVKWRQLLETIEGSSVPLEADTFLHHFWLSKFDYLPAKSLFKTLKKRVTLAAARGFLDQLVADAKLYRSIHEIPFGKWTKQERRLGMALEALVLFRVQQPTPCVLSLVREYKTTKKLRLAHIEDALVALEKFHFLFTAATSQRSSGGISKMYALHARELSEAKDTQAAVKVISDLKKKLRDRVPSLDEFAALFPEILYTDTITKQRKLIKYILAGLHRDKQTATTTDFDSMTIEHIVPQSRISQTLPEEVIGQIGNLVLVPESLNQALDDKEFKEKKDILIKNGVALDNEIKSATKWTAAEIIDRTHVLANEAYKKVWKI